MNISKNHRRDNVITEIITQNQGNLGRIFQVMCECEHCFLLDHCPIKISRERTSCEKVINQYIEKGLD